MEGLSTALTVLSSMITPAVLILACGSLITATSQRLGRVIDRTRKISDRFEQLFKVNQEEASLEEERAILFEQLKRTAKRSKLLQRSMSYLYLALSIFVATSFVIGIVAVTKLKYTWIPILFGMSGAGLLFYSSVLLILESRIALHSVDDEMDFFIKLSHLHFPEKQPNKSQFSRFKFWK